MNFERQLIFCILHSVQYIQNPALNLGMMRENTIFHNKFVIPYQH